MAKARVRWKKQKVVSVAVKDGVSVVAQMLEEPNLVFFSQFTQARDPPVDDISGCGVLFCCAVTRQFLQQSLLGELSIEPRVDIEVPKRRIARHMGSRKVKAWPETPDEREFVSLESRAGGVLIERDPSAPASQGIGDEIRHLGSEDFKSVSDIELAVVWTFPLLNERLHLIHKLGHPVDPLKELVFDQPMKREYKTIVDIMASKGSLADWGYEER